MGKRIPRKCRIFICARFGVSQSWKFIPLEIKGDYLQDVDTRSTIQTALSVNFVTFTSTSGDGLCDYPPTGY